MVSLRALGLVSLSERRLEPRRGEREDDVKTRAEVHLQAKERGFRRNQPRRHHNL